MNELQRSATGSHCHQTKCVRVPVRCPTRGYHQHCLSKNRLGHCFAQFSPCFPYCTECVCVCVRAGDLGSPAGYRMSLVSQFYLRHTRKNRPDKHKAGSSKKCTQAAVLRLFRGVWWDFWRQTNFTARSHTRPSIHSQTWKTDAAAAQS